MINKKTFNTVKESLKGQNLRIVFFALLVVFTLVGLQIIETTTTSTTPVIQIINALLFVGVALLISSVIARAGSSYAMRSTKGIETENRILISKLVSLFVYTVALITILWRLGVRADNIALVIGFVATGFALSVRDIIGSYIAWFVLLRKKPFRIGDTIRIDNIEGLVKHIGTFYVVVDDTPKIPSDYVRVPTTMFIQKPIMNFSRSSIQTSTYVKIKEEHKKMPSIEKLNERLAKIEEASAHARHDFEAGEPILRIHYQYTLDNKTKVQAEIMEITTQHLQGRKPRDIRYKAQGNT